MCTIAGYTGDKRAAPILIDMMRREQFIDGGFSTGIATIHEGRLYTAKVLGDLDELLRTTDAMNFPGTTGIIHTRPTGNAQSHAHPFTDNSNKLALVENGTYRDAMGPEFVQNMVDTMQSFHDRGIEIKSALKGNGSFGMLDNGYTYHPSESYALYIGDQMDHGKDIVTATAEALDLVPADDVIVMIHTEIENTITVGKVTRPIVVGMGENETYLASTALAFPEDMTFRNIISLPVTSVSQITPNALNVTKMSLKNVRTEELTAMHYAKYYQRMEAMLKGQKDSPKSLYDFPLFTDWRDIWSQPYVDCKFSNDTGLLKPYAALAYEVLWAFHKERRLHMVEDRSTKPYTKFWID